MQQQGPGELTEDLVLSQIIKNVYFRDVVLTNLRPAWFEDDANIKLYKALHSLVVKDKVGKLDRKTIALRFNDNDVVNRIFDESDYPNENVDFLIKETEKWAQRRFMEEAIITSADILADGKDTRGVQGLIKEASAFSFDTNLGLNYRDDIDRRFDFYCKVEERISTNWRMLDMFTNGGLQNKTLSVIMAPSGVGKTLFGTNLAGNLMSNGMTGIYLTLELAEEIIARRVDSQLTKIPYYNLPNEKKNVVEFFDNFYKKGGGNLYVKEYPPSRACTLNIRTYLKELELLEKIKPNFLIVDYIQLMKPNNDRGGMNSYEKYGEIAEELRELAVELNIPIITFSQVQREGYGNSNLGLTHMSNSMAIVNTSDLIISMTQTEVEEEEHLQTWRIVKNRLGRKGVSFVMQQDPELLRFDEVINREETEDLEMWEKDHKIIGNPEEEEKEDVNYDDIIMNKDEKAKKEKLIETERCKGFS